MKSTAEAIQHFGAFAGITLLSALKSLIGVYMMNLGAISQTRSKVDLVLCLIVIMTVSLGCLNIKRPWRDYTEKPFNSKEWLAGDEIERGRMAKDVFRQKVPDGKSKEKVLELFGQPDRKVTVEGREVWLYKAENRFHNRLNLLPISFDSKEGTFAGGVKGGTVSMIVDDKWAE